MTVAQLWAGSFGIKNMNAVTFYRIAAHLNDLADSVELRIREIPSLNHKLYLKDVPTLRSMICPNSMTANWDSLRPPLNMGALTALEFCANELGKLHSEEKVTAEDLAQLKTQFSHLLEEVSKSDLATEIKVILLDLLTSALISIEQYQVLGNDGLKKAVSYAVGSLTLHRKQFLASKSQALVVEITEALQGFVKIISAAYKVRELADSMPDISHLLSVK